MYITQPLWEHTYRIIFQNGTDRSDQNSFPTCLVILIGISHNSSHRCSSTLHHIPAWIVLLAPGPFPAARGTPNKQCFCFVGLLFPNTFIQDEIVKINQNQAIITGSSHLAFRKGKKTKWDVKVHWVDTFSTVSQMDSLTLMCCQGESIYTTSAVLKLIMNLYSLLMEL